MNRASLAKIHIARKEMGLSEEQYRDLLGQRYGVASSKELNESQAADLLVAFAAMGWKPAGGKRWGWGKQRYEELAGRPGYFAAPHQLRKIEAVWRDVARNPSDEALEAFIERQTGIKRLIWLHQEHVVPVLTALKMMKRNRNTQDGQ